MEQTRDVASQGKAQHSHQHSARRIAITQAKRSALRSRLLEFYLQRPWGNKNRTFPAYKCAIHLLPRHNAFVFFTLS